MSKSLSDPAPPERSETKKPCAENAENEARMQRINQATAAAAEIVAGLPYAWLGGGDSGQRAVRYVDSDAARRVLALAYIAEAEARAAALSSRERAGESREAEHRELIARADEALKAKGFWRHPGYVDLQALIREMRDAIANGSRSHRCPACGESERSGHICRVCLAMQGILTRVQQAAPDGYDGGGWVCRLCNHAAPRPRERGELIPAEHHHDRCPLFEYHAALAARAQEVQK